MAKHCDFGAIDAMVERQGKLVQRQRVYEKRDEILELVAAGKYGREIRILVGLEDVPERTFHYHLAAIKKQAETTAALARNVLAADAMRMIRPNPPKAKSAPKKSAESAPKGSKGKASTKAPTGAKRAGKGSVRITKLGKGAADRKPLDPSKWGDKK